MRTPEYKSFEDALTALKRKRKDVYVVHMTADSEAAQYKCVHCGLRLSEVAQGSTRPDRWSTWTYQASSKRIGNGRHYACSWSMLFTQIFQAADDGLLG